MKIKIRRAVIGDGQLIAECFNKTCKGLCKNCFNKYVCNESMYSKRSIINIERKLKLVRQYYALIALDEKKIVGFASFYCGRLSTNKHVAECGWFVDIEHSHQGIATTLLHRLLAQAKKLGIKRLEAEIAVQNTPSIGLAKKLGFKIEGRKQKALFLEDKTYADTYFMAKLLR